MYGIYLTYWNSQSPRFDLIPPVPSQLGSSVFLYPASLCETSFWLKGLGGRNDRVHLSFTWGVIRALKEQRIRFVVLFSLELTK